MNYNILKLNHNNMYNSNLLSIFNIYEYWAPLNQLAIENISNGYFVSTFGRIWSAKRSMILTPTNSLGYLYVMLRTVDGNQVRKRIHRLVMLSFNYREDHTKWEVNHIDGNKTNNCIWNLEWISRSDNMKHAVLNGLAVSGEDSYLCTITERQAIQICELLNTQLYTTTQVADIVGCSVYVVRNIANGAAWKQLSCNYPNIGKSKITRLFPNDIAEKVMQFIRDNYMYYDSKNALFRAIRDKFCNTLDINKSNTALHNLYNKALQGSTTIENTDNISGSE